MDKNNAIIIPEVFGELPICDFVPQTAIVLSKSNPVYIYFTNFPKKRFTKNIIEKSKNIYYCYPREIFPFIRFSFVRYFNNQFSFLIINIYCSLKYSSKPIFWFFYPQLVNLIKLPIKPQKIVYDIVDNFTSPIFKDNQKLKSQKKYLLDHADIVTSISNSLIKISKKISPKTKIHLVPQGFNVQKSISINPNLDRIKKIPNKVGFIGGIGNRLDYKLLLNLIPTTLNINYIFVGPISIDRNSAQKPVNKLTKKLFSFPNVYHIDTVAKNQIFQFIQTFDIGIIPYDIDQEFNKYCYPMKLFEYFSAGKPVIATPIEELKKFPNFVKIGSNPLEWKKHILETLKNFPPHFQTQAKKLAKQNSWQNKINQTTSFF